MCVLLSSSIWAEVAPEMFTGGFSPSTYCQQFKALSAAVLCMCAHVRTCVCRGTGRQRAVLEGSLRTRSSGGNKMEGISENLNAAVVAECDACRPSCQNKCGLFMPQQTGLLKADIFMLTLYIFMSCLLKIHRYYFCANN